MSGNRSADLLNDVLTRLKNNAELTALLPDGADNIHPKPRPVDRELDVSLNVGMAGGNARGEGRTERAERLVQVQLEASPEHYESQATGWMENVLDVVEAELGGIGGGGRAPDGRSVGISPVYDEAQDRYLADTTERFATVHQ